MEGGLEEENCDHSPPLLTCLIANLPCCTNHTVMAADRVIRSDCLAGPRGTDATAY